jgi:hypothetical protein
VTSGKTAGILGAIVVAVVSGIVLQYTGALIQPPPDKASPQQDEPVRPPETPHEQPPPKPVVMRALERGVNRAGSDFDGYGRHAENAELCAELCRTDASCDSMTYVISLKTCWLKSGVPNPSSDSDMVSAVKER